MLDGLRTAIANGDLPTRDLPRAIAALSVHEAEYVAAAIADGWRYWNFRESGGYWETWRPGELGTMADARGPISLRAAHEALVIAGLELADAGRCFAAELSCIACGVSRRGALHCGHDAARIVTVEPLPTSINDCVIFAADLAGIARAERAARALRDRPHARVVWRAISARTLAHLLTAAHLAEQAPLVELGYLLDPFAYHDEAIALVAPGLGDG